MLRGSCATASSWNAEKSSKLQFEMLSFQKSSDPSLLSSKLPEVLKLDEGSTYQQVFQETNPAAVGDIRPSNSVKFSLRDYVARSRRRNIETNWPFSNKILKLCLNNGVDQILPPFEPPNLIRAEYGRRESDLYVLSKIESDSIELNVSCGGRFMSNLIIGSSDHARHSSQNEELNHNSSENLVARISNEAVMGELKNDDDAEIISDTVPEVQPSEDASKSDFCEFSRQKFSEPSGLSYKPPRKKRSQLVRFGSIQEITCTNEIVFNSVGISYHVSSKVCPVCKVFSSSSNTTLNAHIDQCLCVESFSNISFSEVSRAKVKMTKKRAVADIYETAAFCTLEELDRRNGTNWASDLASCRLLDVNLQEKKRPKLFPTTDVIVEMRDSSVYVDSNGIKLRILGGSPSSTTEGKHAKPKDKKQQKKFRTSLKPSKSKIFAKGWTSQKKNKSKLPRRRFQDLELGDKRSPNERNRWNELRHRSHTAILGDDFLLKSSGSTQQLIQCPQRRKGNAIVDFSFKSTNSYDKGKRLLAVEEVDKKSSTRSSEKESSNFSEPEYESKMLASSEEEGNQSFEMRPDVSNNPRIREELKSDSELTDSCAITRYKWKA